MYEDEKNKLRLCIEQYEKRVHNLLGTLGWTTENTLKEYNNETLSECREKFDKNDPLYPDTLVAKNFVKFDMKTLEHIFNSSNKLKLPQKFSDFQVIFNKEDKLSLYEYVINKTGKLTEPEVTVLHYNDNNEGTSSPSTKHMTFNEIVAMRRDEKRRRLKYRTTKTAPLSVTEELRNLIEIQMQAFDQYIKQSSNQLPNEIKSKHGNSRKKHKRSKSSHRNKTNHHKYKKKIKENN